MKACEQRLWFTLRSVFALGTPGVAKAHQPNGHHRGKGHVSGAPGPIAGAGLPASVRTG